jgi:hypothetical protein
MGVKSGSPPKKGKELLFISPYQLNKKKVESRK